MKKSPVTYLIIFLLTAAAFSFLYFRIPELRDYDSYFHTKMGQIVMDKGFIHEFPWAQLTFVKDHYVNPYFLFHIYLGLWIKLLPVGPMVAVKLAMIFLISLIAAGYFGVLKVLHAKWAWLGLALLPATLALPVYERLTFVRPHVASILILILGIGAILKKKWWLLGVLSVLYSYSYSAPHLLPVVALIASVVFSAKERRAAWEPFAFSLGGMVAGLIVNPYFPRDFGFLYTVTFKMAVREPTITSIVPSELISIPGREILRFNLVSFAALSLAVLAVFVMGKKLSARSLFLFVTTGFFLVLLLRSFRFIEYWPFIASLCVFSLLSETVLESPRFEKVMKKSVAVLAVVALLAVGAVMVRYVGRHAPTFVPYASLKELTDVLNAEAQPGDIVYTKNWDQTQPMFYLADKVYYLVMFDPEMARLAHPGLYDLWYCINIGRVRDNNLSLIKAIEAARMDPEIQRLRADLESGRVADRLPDIIRSAFRAKWIIMGHSNAREQSEVRSLMATYPADIIFMKGNERFSLYRLK